MASVVPQNDRTALSFMRNVVAKLTARPQAFGVSAQDALNLARVVELFGDALAVILDPEGKTKPAVLEKNQAKAAAVQLAQSFLVRIKFDEGVSDVDKEAVGVRPVNPSRAPVPPPQTAPVLDVVAAASCCQTIRFHDKFNPDSRARPAGVARLELFVAVGDAPATDPEQARYLQGYGRGPIGVAFGREDDGKVATYFARWASTRNEVGPWSAPVSMRVAA